MKILFLSRFDWANASNRIARTIHSSTPHEAHVLVAGAHPFGYQEDWIVQKHNHLEIFDWCRDLDWLISGGDGDYGFYGFMRELLPLPRDVRQATMHAGTAYRTARLEFNQTDAEIGFLARFMCADLYRYSLDDPGAVPYIAPPDRFGSLERPPGRVRIAHSPSNRGTKGTATILKVLEKFRGDADIDLIEGVPYAECIERRARAHILVDQMKPDIGAVGAAAMEAMAAGSVVMADVRNVHERCYGFWSRPPVVDVRDAEQLGDVLSKFIRDRDALEYERMLSFDWACNNMSPAPVARFYLGQLEKAEARRISRAAGAASTRLIGRSVELGEPAAGHVLAVLTAPRQEPTLDATFRSLKRAGIDRWDVPKLLMGDGVSSWRPADWGCLYTPVSEGGVASILTLFTFFLKDQSREYLTFFEDDVVLAENALDYIKRVKVDPDLALISWHSQHDHVCGNERAGGERGLLLLPVESFSRMQGVTIPRRTVELVVKRLDPGKLGRNDNDQIFAGPCAGQVYGVHLPNIVQHVGGEVSSVGNTGARLSPTFVGEGFDVSDWLDPA